MFSRGPESIYFRQPLYHNYIFIILFYVIFDTLYIESAWKVFTDTSIPSDRTYLFVHHHDDESQNELFTSNGNSHAEQKFIEDFKEDNEKRYRAGGKQVKLDVYLTHPINYAGQLKTFAEEYSFHLNIVVGACQEMEEELCDLMTSGYCAVRSFTKDDYKTLAKYLHFPIIPQATIVKRDKKTEGKLRNIQCSEYN